MGDKYKIKKSNLKQLFATAEMLMQNSGYRSLFERLELRQGKNKNFFCINEGAHSQGNDRVASLSVDDKTGQWHCFTCGIKGNFQTYWRDYLQGNQYGTSFTDFIIDFLKINTMDFMGFGDSDEERALEKNARQIEKLYNALQNERLADSKKPHILNGELSKMVKKLSRLDMGQLDSWVEALVNNEEKMEYLWKTRRITEEIVRRYKIGWYEHHIKPASGDRFSEWKFIFPVISAEGDFINAKVYNPWTKNPNYKWMHPFKGMQYGPIPINNFTKNKIYFFEGEPDCYCAIAMGIEGAVTFGSAAKKDVVDVFGKDHSKQLFFGKEIVIVKDSDEASAKWSNDLALSLYPYASQIKVIDLDISDINPHGLDPNAVADFTFNKVTKTKRTEKDFTDFMEKNGFEENARTLFDNLVDRSDVFTYDLDREREVLYKVTVQESRQAKYNSPDRMKRLEIIASVSDFNCNAYMYPTEISINCKRIIKEDHKRGCDMCSIADICEAGSNNAVNLKIVRDKTKEMINDPSYIQATDHDILGLIEVTDTQRSQQLKKICGINTMCRVCTIIDVQSEKLIHVSLAKDVGEFTEHDVNDDDEEEIGATADFDVEAYIRGDSDIYPNKSYKFKAVQTTAWFGQQAVLSIDKAEPIETSIESFKMDQDIHDLLKIFRPKENETVEQQLDRKYKVFSGASGITGRKDIFFMNDLAFFSCIEIRNKMLPGIKRGWVEVLIAGDSRTGKTVITKFLHNHYKIGEIVAGSSAVSRTGLLGGVTTFKGKSSISWGKIPMNDKGIVIIDEMSRIDIDTLIDLVDVRSEGVAQVTKSKSGKAAARVRKIMMSNARGWKVEDQKEYNYGIQFLRELCLQDSIFARFDVAFVVREDDVDSKDFESDYAEITTEFNEYQCRHLIMWAYSRKPNDFIIEKGLNEYINECSIKMNEDFHSSTQLVNQEQRAKLVRMSVSLATMLYSTPDDDWNKVLVKKEHVDYIVKFLYKLYCHKNMKMDLYSQMKGSFDTLGDMGFMEDISHYVDLRPMLNEEEFTSQGIQQIFYDYIHKVSDKELYIVDAKTDKVKRHGMYANEVNQKLIGILTTRNCLTRTKRGAFKKTKMFNSWLEERSRLGDKATRPYILELNKNQSNTDFIESIETGQDNRRTNKKRKSG